eukprot:g4693.t1
MSELKRKREEDSCEEEGPSTADATRRAPTGRSSPPPEPAPLAPAPTTAAEPTREGELAAAPETTPNATEDSGAPAEAREAPAAAAPSSSPRAPKQKKRHEPPPPAKIMICGKEVTVKHTGGRKKRKPPIETLTILAYKGQLALACRANNMVSALEIYREMKAKDIQRDLSTHMMVLSLCGGSPGEKDELNPGNGATGQHVAALEKAADGDADAEARVEGASAQDDTHAAAEAALQIFSEASKGGTVSLPESAYTAVIRACCLDGRADKAREVLAALKRADVRPRVRTYAPLLEAYAGLDGRLQDCMDLWREAVSPAKTGQPGITMTEREYLHLIAACTRAKDEKCFLEVMSEYMDDVLQPRSRHSWDVLKAWFRVGPNDIGNAVTEEPTKRRQADLPEEGEIVGGGDAAAAAPADTSAVCSKEQRKEESSDDASTHVAEGDGGAEHGTVASVPATLAAPVASPAASTADAEKTAEAAIAQAEAPVPTPAAAAAAPEPQEAAAGGAPVAAATAVSSCTAHPTVEGAAAADADVGAKSDSVGGGGDCNDAASKGSQSAATADGGGGGGWSVVECKVGTDGRCENCGEVLRSVDLSKEDEERLLQQIEELVCTNEQRTKQWKGFCGWLQRRGKERYNVIIDGANLGYYKQAASCQDELADLQQVDWAVRKYEEQGKKPLVVLHSRHLVEKWLSDESREILKRWKEAEIIQSCAPKNNDDWYWLYAAVFAGGRVLVLTNDEMRDHHFSMLSHRSFQRWKERHQARFSFGEWNEETSSRELITEEPRSYSKRTQKGVDSWHVPLEKSSDWLCARWRR